MAAPKGFLPPAAGMGRVKGVPNKSTRELKEMIVGALEQAGGQNYLLDQSKKNPVAFLSLVAKIIPNQTQVDVNIYERLTLDEQRSLAAALAAIAFREGGPAEGFDEAHH